MKATIIDLRYKMKDVLAAIDRGESVTVLHRGKEKAQLTPVFGESNSLNGSTAMIENQLFFGMWSDREDLADPVSYVRNLRQNRLMAPKATGKKRSGGQKLPE